ncbi:MAG: ATP-dependent zinc metalloprotease FtsH [Puniceicoccales bacterium]|jgi:cell division protease FtsH|nr:ATP-dependent zinc metalloprotease FtsH [Puniceicoccales bacterium]
MGKRKQKPLGRFQPKVFAIWGALILSLVLAWTLISPADPTQNVQWSVNDVAEAASSGRLLSGEIRSVPGRGIQWYRIRGQAYPESGATKPIEFSAQGRLTDARFHQIIATNVLRERPSGTFLADLALSVLPFFIILLLLYFFFARQVRGAGKNALTFGKSRARLYDASAKKVTFKDVAGCDEAKEEVSEIVDFLRDPKKFNEIGGRIPKGCLMVGPPGTGKTLLAKAVAGEAEVPFFSISGSDFVEMFVGVGAARVRDLFEQGRKNAPCIIFIDEIDAVGRQRGAGLGGGNDEREQTLNSILVEMDGFDGREGVILVAATNRPDVLDSALLRPGRFDRQIVIDLPDINGREEILQVHAKKIKLTGEVDLKIIARNTPGFAGADLENLLNEGALLAARRGKKQVEPTDLEEAREKVAYGRERKKLMDDDDKKITAYHEAGHAIVQATIDDGLLPVHKVTIIPRGRSLGSTMFMPTKDILNHSLRHALNQICCAMGGRVAEELVLGEISSGASCDIKSATQLARRMVCDWGMSPLGPIAFGENADHIFLGRDITRNQNYSERTAQLIDGEVSNILTGQHRRATEILEKSRPTLEAVAQALLRYETLEGSEVYAALKRGNGKAIFRKSKKCNPGEVVSPEADKKMLSDPSDVSSTTESAATVAQVGENAEIPTVGVELKARRRSGGSNPSGKSSDRSEI